MTDEIDKATERLGNKLYPEWGFIGDEKDAIRTELLAAEQRGAAASWEPVCMDTGAKSVAGSCPIHNGDACLVAKQKFTELENAHSRLASLREAIEGMRLHSDAVDTRVLHSNGTIERILALPQWGAPAAAPATAQRARELLDELESQIDFTLDDATSLGQMFRDVRDFLRALAEGGE